MTTMATPAAPTLLPAAPLGHHPAPSSVSPATNSPPPAATSAASSPAPPVAHPALLQQFRADLLLANGTPLKSGGAPVSSGAKPVYATASPVESTPQNNECKLVEVKGAKLASFTVKGTELICLPQAFDVFLKHLVGGLHTVYTKLKRLDIAPVVCNVEQVLSCFYGICQAVVHYHSAVCHPIKGSHISKPGLFYNSSSAAPTTRESSNRHVYQKAPSSREISERVSYPTGQKLPAGLHHTPFIFPEGLSSIETLLTNIQGLLRVAIENARAQEKQDQLERTELKMELVRERELRETLERQLSMEQKNRVLIQKRLKKEKRSKRKLQEALEEEVKLRDQAEHSLLHTASTHVGHQSMAATPHAESVTQDAEGSGCDDNRLDTKAMQEGRMFLQTSGMY
uniref:SKI/SNO/DAC domain-containing protein n=1 Tax=Nothobranchius rachovii TaxID=451742 RepID=A0A1A8R0A7_9TELE